jgi:hypothetical protein
MATISSSPVSVLYPIAAISIALVIILATMPPPRSPMQVCIASYSNCVFLAV